MEFVAATHQRGIENHHQHHGHNHHHHHHQQQQQQPQFNDDNTTSYIHSQTHPLRGDSLRHHLARNDHHHHHYDQLLGVANAVSAAQPNGANILNHIHQQRQQLLPSLHLESAHLQQHNITINNNTLNSSTTSSTTPPTCQQSSQNQQQQLLNTTANSTSSSGGNSNSGGTNINNHSNSQRSSGKKWSKRIRTTFTPEQLKQLEDEFSRQMYLVGEYRQFLAKSLGLSEGQVKVWFQNRRIKHRKLNK